MFKISTHSFIRKDIIFMNSYEYIPIMFLVLLINIDTSVELSVCSIYIAFKDMVRAIENIATYL